MDRATAERTLDVMRQVESYVLKQPEVESMVSVLDFSFSGQGQNAGLVFVPLKPWDERKGAEHVAQAIAGRFFGALSSVRDAILKTMPKRQAQAFEDMMRRAGPVPMSRIEQTRQEIMATVKALADAGEVEIQLFAEQVVE